MWDNDAASRALGMELASVAPGRAVVTMTVRADMVNGWDVCHGGLIASLADSAFAVACNSRGTGDRGGRLRRRPSSSPARLGDVLVATAEERALRGRSGLYDVTVAAATIRGAVVAEFRGRSRSLGRPIEG